MSKIHWVGLIKNFVEENKEHSAKVHALAEALASVKNSNESQELKDAYTYAYLRGITTQPSIEKSELHRGLTRAEMAKMMSVFAMKVLGKGRKNWHPNIYRCKEYGRWFTRIYPAGISTSNYGNWCGRESSSKLQPLRRSKQSRICYNCFPGYFGELSIIRKEKELCRAASECPQKQRFWKIRILQWRWEDG